jgi:hypothetical protein
MGYACSIVRRPIFNSTLLVAWAREMGYGLVEAVGNRIKFFPRKSADAADRVLTRVLTPEQEAEVYVGQYVQPLDFVTADSADAVLSGQSRSLVSEGIAEHNGTSSRPTADLPVNNAMGVSSVSNSPSW